MTLGLRLGRRLIAAVALGDEHIAFHECRFVSSRKDTMERAMRDYFAKILGQLSPARICYYAPTTIDTATHQLSRILVEQAAALGIPVIRIERAALLASCGLPTGAKRAVLKDRMQDLWPTLAEGRLDRQLVCAEALVSALAGELEP